MSSISCEAEPSFGHPTGRVNHMTTEDADKGITTRLRRIEGQVQGIQRMLDGGRECEEVLTQIMAVRSSLDAVGIMLMERHIERCVLEGLPPDSPVTREVSEAL